MRRATQSLLHAIGVTPPLPAVLVGADGAAPFSCAAVHDDWGQVKAHGGLHHDGVPTVAEATGGPGAWALIGFDPHEYEVGHAAELVGQAAAALAPGGKLLVAAPPRYPAEKWEALLRGRFSVVQPEGEIYRCSKPAAGGAAAGDGELPGSGAFAYEAYGCRFVTAPGIFSPGGLDAGTALMLEHLLPQVPGRSLLDLGCGAGVVGVTAAKAGALVTAVDVRARALRFTRLNAERNGVSLTVQPSDGVADLGEQRFDLIATNPPYHEDFGVARRFVEGARDRLAEGGVLYLVVKRAGWYAEKLKAVFGGYRLEERDGYSLFVAERRAPRPGGGRKPEKAPTKKHQKRIEASARKKR